MVHLSDGVICGEVFYLFGLILILRKNYYRYEKVFMCSDDLYASPA